MRVTPERKQIQNKSAMTKTYYNSEKKGLREAMSDNFTEFYYIYTRI